MKEDKNGNLIPEKGDLSVGTLKEVAKSGYDLSLAQQKRRQIIAERVIKVRKKNGYSQNEFSKTLKVVVSTYCGYEKGRHDFPAEVIVRICEQYNVSADYILGITDDINKKPTAESESDLSQKLSAIKKLLDN